MLTFIDVTTSYLIKKLFVSEILGSHGGEYEDDCLLGGCTV
jgi:hypothetical protein